MALVAADFIKLSKRSPKQVELISFSTNMLARLIVFQKRLGTRMKGRGIVELFKDTNTREAPWTGKHKQSCHTL